MKRTHGMTNTKEYKTWSRIKQKCYNPKHIAYEKYGAKGVVFEFKDNFIAFLEEVGPCPEQSPKWSIERINPSLGYVKGNMMWLESNKQQHNRKKLVTNTSGVTGVYASGKKWTAEWWEEGQRSRQTFLTFEEAVAHREKMLDEMRQRGVYIPETHGK